MLTRSLSKLMLDSPTSSKLVHQPNFLLFIPEELLAHIISFLSLSDIGVMCLTGSTLLKDRVVAWITTTSCCKKVMVSLTKEMMNQEAGYDEWVKVCRQFGLLCKRVSMLHSTSTRLKLLSSWYSRLECLVCGEMGSDWARLWGRLGLAAATSSFSLGWDETEFGKVVGWLRDRETDQQWVRRRVLRIFFWEFVDNEDTQACWLSHIIRTFTDPSAHMAVEHQAADLLFILLGPANKDDSTFVPQLFSGLTSFQCNLYTKLQGMPDWTIMQEQVPASYAEAKEMFSDLGKALRLLIRSSSITRSFLTSIMTFLFEEQHWNLDNQAACLLFSCEDVVKMYLRDLTRRKGGIVKLSHMLAAMLAVCGRLSNDLNQNPRLCSILDWSFTILEGGTRMKMIAEFWKEVAEKMEEGDIVEEILVQLGVFVCGKAYDYGGGRDKGRVCEGARELEE